MTFGEVLALTNGHELRRRHWSTSYINVSLAPQAGGILIKYVREGAIYNRLSLSDISYLLGGNDWETMADLRERNKRRDERVKKLRKGVFISREQCNIRCVVTRKQGDIVEIEPAPYEDDFNDESDGCAGGCSQFIASDSLNLVEHVTG